MAETQEALLSRAVTGDREAFSALLVECGQIVRPRIAGRIGAVWQGVIEADDIMQVAYMHAFVHIGDFSSKDVAAFTAWLQRIAENNLLDAIRGLEAAKRPNPHHRVRGGGHDASYVELLDVIAATNSTPSEGAARREAKAIILQVIDRLPPDYRDVVRLCELEGRSAGDVAVQMQRSRGAVFMLLARAHERMRELLPSVSQLFSTPS